MELERRSPEHVDAYIYICMRVWMYAGLKGNKLRHVILTSLNYLLYRATLPLFLTLLFS